jgi:hypothetical protein
VDAATAEAWFAELRSGVPWRTERRMMYDPEVDVPRLMGHFRLDSAPALTPPSIVDAAVRVVSATAVPFNSVGLNLYRDGRDSVDRITTISTRFGKASRLRWSGSVRYAGWSYAPCRIREA